jgi:putative membrane protein
MNIRPSRTLLAIALGLAVACGSAAAQTNEAQSDRAAPTPATRSNAADAAFVEKASAAGLTEVAAGKAATEKSQSDQVKTFGQQMVDDHTKAGDELKSIAQTKGIAVSPTPMASDTKALASMSNLSGPAFDAAFKKKMVGDHEKVIALFKKESAGGSDPDLKAFATKTLPTLQHHLEMAKALPATK